MAEEKKETAEDRIRKRFGQDAVFTFKDNPLKIESVSTGSMALDQALGVGGIPYGRVTEIFGDESSGKSTVCQYVIANAQKTGRLCGYVDMEQALDPVYAQICGVDMETLRISQPENGEEALEIAEEYVRDNYGVVVVDSVASLVPKAEIDRGMGDASMGMQARLMSQALRKLGPFIKKHNTAVIFTNQTRQKIGVMYGNPETTPGGLALKFYASVRVRLHAKKQMEGKLVVASDVTANVIKNKVAIPFGKAEFSLKFGQGIDHYMELVDMGAKLEVITRRGAFFSYGDTRLGQGAENARNFLEGNPVMAAEIEAKIRGSNAPAEIDGSVEA